MKKRVIAAGHICIDITPIFPEKKAGALGEILIPGKLLHMNGVDVHTGGSAANTGLGMQKLGADVRILGKVGCDSFGDMIQEILKKHGITEGLIRDEKSSTSYSIVLAVPGVDRIFLHDPGANDTYQESDIREEDLTGAELFHFGYPPLMKSMYENEGEELAKLLQRIKSKGIPVSLDMAAVDEDSTAGQEDWLKILQKTLPYVDIFLPSIEEILFMVDREKYHALLKKAAGRDFIEVLNIEKDVKPTAEKLLDMGAKIVVLKCGSAGLYLATGRQEALKGLVSDEWADKRIFEGCYKPEVIRSGTGAGDTCIAAFLLAVLNGETPEMAVRLAAAQGASCVEAYDALSGLRTLEELKTKIADGWEKSERP